jgi:hypothetical protein
MASVIIVHGIAQQFLGPNALHGKLAGAFLDGVVLCGGPRLSVDDVEIAFYGDLFRRPGTKGPNHSDADNLSDPWSIELIMRWWAGAAGAEPDLVESPERLAMVKTKTPRIVQHALYAMARSRWLAGIGERLLIGTVAQAWTYLHDDGIRARARQAVATLITPQTRVVIAHSLGSVVAYEALCRLSESRRLCFVTLGSPLGIPNLFFDRLRPEPQNGLGRWPPCVTTWTNVCDTYDIVALVKDLARLFPGVVDRRVDNGWKAHELLHYLTASEVGAAVAAGLRERAVD